MSGLFPRLLDGVGEAQVSPGGERRREGVGGRARQHACDDGLVERELSNWDESLALAQRLGPAEEPARPFDLARQSSDAEEPFERVRDSFLIADPGGDIEVLEEALRGWVEVTCQDSGLSDVVERDCFPPSVLDSARHSEAGAEMLYGFSNVATSQGDATKEDAGEGAGERIADLDNEVKAAP